MAIAIRRGEVMVLRLSTCSASSCVPDSVSVKEEYQTEGESV